MHGGATRTPSHIMLTRFDPELGADLGIVGKVAIKVVRAGIVPHKIWATCQVVKRAIIRVVVKARPPDFKVAGNVGMWSEQYAAPNEVDVQAFTLNPNTRPSVALLCACLSNRKGGKCDQ